MNVHKVSPRFPVLAPYAPYHVTERPGFLIFCQERKGKGRIGKVRKGSWEHGNELRGKDKSRKSKVRTRQTERRT